MNILDYIRFESPEYMRISEAFSGKFSKRTGAPYMRHIDQGLTLLHVMGADATVLRAWCVHPLFQNDELFIPILKSYKYFSTESVIVTVLAMEYRKVANAFLVPDLELIAVPKISPIDEVNTMLIADKVQNYREVQLHRKQLEPSEHLDRYFSKWFMSLKVTEPQRKFLEHKLG